jgi:hypothetical protein
MSQSAPLEASSLVSTATPAAANASSAPLLATGVHSTYLQPQTYFPTNRTHRRVLHDACPTAASLHRLFSANNIDGGLCLVCDSPQVSFFLKPFFLFSLGVPQPLVQGLGLLQCRVWGAVAVEEWPLNVLGLCSAKWDSLAGRVVMFQFRFCRRACVRVRWLR